ncbi:MAG TPA: CBS domain-containing protein [Gemmatimonadales bacterium]|nr:CBS domain-containing protein [Gemmatimonadales bacterium]
MPTVRDILARKGTSVVTVTPDSTVLAAAQLMNTKGIGAVLVVEGSELRGIFTERDVMRRVVAEERPPATTVVGDVMSTGLVTAKPETTMDECAAMMTARRIRHLPVLGPDGLAGVVTIGDLTAFQVADQAATIAHLNSYVYENR